MIMKRFLFVLLIFFFLIVHSGCAGEDLIIDDKLAGTAEVNQPTYETEQPHEQIITADVISEELAIDIAFNSHPYSGPCDCLCLEEEHQHTFSYEVVEAKYLESTNPSNDPSWFVLFKELSWGESSIDIPDGYSADQFIEEYPGLFPDDGSTHSVVTNNDGTSSIVTVFNRIYFNVIEINALSSERLGFYSINTDDTSLNAFDSVEDLKQNISLIQE